MRSKRPGAPQAVGNGRFRNGQACGFHRGNSQGRVELLMAPGQPDLPRRRLLDKPERGPHPRGCFLERHGGLGGLRRAHGGDARLENPRLLRSDLAQRPAQVLPVIHPNAGDDRHARGDRSRGVEPASQPRFERDRYDPFVPKPNQAEGGGDLEKSRRRLPAFDEFADPGQARGNGLFGNEDAVDLQTLPK